MSVYSMKISISPGEAIDLVRSGMNADLVHEEMHQPTEDKAIGTLVFEKYYFRVKNRVALVVIADNFYGETEVRVISTAGSEGLILSFDWGASENFARKVEEILKEYIVGS